MATTKAAKKGKASLAVWRPAVTRISGDAICTGELFVGVLWADAESVVTLDLAGTLTRWSAAGVRARARTIGGAGAKGLSRLGEGRALVRSGARLVVIDPRTLESVSEQEGLCDAYGLATAGGGRVVVGFDDRLVVYREEGGGLVERGRWAADLTAMGYEKRGRLGADGVWLGARLGREAWRLHGLDDGSVREVPALRHLLAIDAGGSRGFGQVVEDGVWRWGEVDLVEGRIARALGDRVRIFVGAAAVEDGWILADEHEVWRCDAAGRTRWSLGLGMEVLDLAVSPDGARVAVMGGARVVIVDARTGARIGPVGPEGRVVGLGFVADPPQVVAMVRESPYEFAEHAHRWSTAGAYVGAYGLRYAVVEDGWLIGEGYADPATRLSPRLERVSLTTAGAAAEPLGACAPVLSALCASEGRVIYDAYAGGGKWSWTLRRGVDDGAGWMEAVFHTRPKRPDGVRLTAGTGGLVAVTTTQDRVEVFDAGTGALRFDLKGVGKWATGAAFTSDGAWLVVGGTSKVIAWSMATGEARWAVKADKGFASGLVAMSGDDRYFVSASATAGRLKVYAVESGAEVAEVELGTPGVSALGFGGDGRIYFACADGHVYAAALGAEGAGG